MVDYIGVSDIQRLVHGIGTGEFIERLAREIEADYRRWSEFEKSARLASHSPVGVIELMPTSDGRLYSFKYVNGHPKNTARRAADRHGVRRAGRRRHRLPAAALGAHRHDGAAHRGDVGARGAVDGARRQPRHGADRQRRAERIPGDRASIACSASASCGSTTSIRSATAKLERNLRSDAGARRPARRAREVDRRTPARAPTSSRRSRPTSATP